MESIRSHAWIWYLRLFQALIAVIVLAITGSTASTWHSIDCDTPSRLSYNISCAALTLPLVLYFIFSSGPVASLRRLPWSRWVQLGLDALFFLLWLVSAGVSSYTCDGLCSSCSDAGREVDEGSGFYVYFGSAFCNCYFPGVDNESLSNEKRSMYRRAGGGYRSGEGNGFPRGGLKASKHAAKQGFDAVMVVLFFTTLGTTALLIYRHRNGEAGGPAAHRDNHQQTNYPQAGLGRSNP